MKFRIYWIGSNADAEFKQAIERYAERIRHFFSLEIVEIAPEKDRQKKSDLTIIRAESARLTAALPPKGTTVVLDERGEMLDSLKFAKWLEGQTVTSPNGVNFVLGGDLGLDEGMRGGADRVMALSAMTLPHQIARTLLLEQIYRACTIMRNIRYHK
jgi:23S rRNA (pseudouridine1915-N3)-methyltransferase